MHSSASVSMYICIDINECNYGACSQICVNTEGSYTCDCIAGYHLMSDNSSCDGMLFRK